MTTSTPSWCPSSADLEVARVLADRGTMTRDEIAEAVPAMATSKRTSGMHRRLRRYGRGEGMAPTSEGRTRLRGTLRHLERRGLILRDEHDVTVPNPDLLRRWANLAEQHHQTESTEAS